MLKSIFALFLAVCLPLGSATTYKAAYIDFCEDSGCSDADNGIVLSFPDGICFYLEAQGIYIQEFLGDCTFRKFDYTKLLMKIVERRVIGIHYSRK